MGQNSKKVLARILNLYPHLKNRSTLTYGVIVGISHKPEVYIRKAGYKVQVIEPSSEHPPEGRNVSEMLGYLLRQGKTKEDKCMKDILAIGVLTNAFFIFAGIDLEGVDLLQRILIGNITYGDVEKFLFELPKVEVMVGEFVPDDYLVAVAEYLSDICNKFA
jgi:hypothetical protein